MTQLRSIMLAGAIAAAALGAPAAQAQYYAAPPPPPGYYHHWHHGDHYYGPRHVVEHWRRYDLPPPPYGTVWVHDGPGFLLLDGYGTVLRYWGP